MRKPVRIGDSTSSTRTTKLFLWCWPAGSSHNSGQMSRILRRLYEHGLLKKVRHCYKYYLAAASR